MVDVSQKSTTDRMAIAQGEIAMQPDTLALIVAGEHKKGDVLGVARIAGIMAAKKTAELIPLCHPIGIDKISVDFEAKMQENTLICRVQVFTRAQTGVEMEALTATQIALLTVYDMCKAVDRGMKINNIQLIEKKGGKSGHWKAQ